MSRERRPTGTPATPFGLNARGLDCIISSVETGAAEPQHHDHLEGNRGQVSRSVTLMRRHPHARTALTHYSNVGNPLVCARPCSSTAAQERSSRPVSSVTDRRSAPSWITLRQDEVMRSFDELVGEADEVLVDG